MYHKIPSIRYSYSFLVGVHTWILNLSVNLGSVVHGILYMEFILDRLAATHTLQFVSSQPWILTAVQVISFAVQIISY